MIDIQFRYEHSISRLKRQRFPAPEWPAVFVGLLMSLIFQLLLCQFIIYYYYFSCYYASLLFIIIIISVGYYASLFIIIIISVVTMPVLSDETRVGFRFSAPDWFTAHDNNLKELAAAGAPSSYIEYLNVILRTSKNSTGCGLLPRGYSAAGVPHP